LQPEPPQPCYILAMYKPLVLAVLAAVVAVPAFASKHKVSHPHNVHAQNPYLKHPKHKAHQHHHKKV
jgi:hypothetical protein